MLVNKSAFRNERRESPHVRESATKILDSDEMLIMMNMGRVPVERTSHTAPQGWVSRIRVRLDGVRMSTSVMFA